MSSDANAKKSLNRFGNFSLGIFGAIALVISLTGCSSPEEKAAREKEQAEYEAKAKHKRENPDVKLIGTFDGCEVKFYERGYSTENFYIAKCIGSSNTTTVSKIERYGKSNAVKFDVTQEVSELEAKKAQFKAEIEALDAKRAEITKKKELAEKAKQKLSAEELEALGISNKQISQ